MAFRDEEGYIPLLGDINLAIHETGHYVFLPFGELMTYLGGAMFAASIAAGCLFAPFPTTKPRPDAAEATA